MRFKIFVSGEINPDFLSRRIMKRFKTNYSHIGMIVIDNQGFTTIYHSVGEGFSAKNYDDFCEEHHMQEIDITRYILNEDYALGYLNGRIGVEYSFSQYLGFVFKSLQGLTRNGKEKGICSEEAARFMFHCCQHNLKIDQSKFDFVSPKDVWEKLKEVVNKRA